MHIYRVIEKYLPILYDGRSRFVKIIVRQDIASYIKYMIRTKTNEDS